MIRTSTARPKVFRCSIRKLQRSIRPKLRVPRTKFFSLCSGPLLKNSASAPFGNVRAWIRRFCRVAARRARSLDGKGNIWRRELPRQGGSCAILSCSTELLVYCMSNEYSGMRLARARDCSRFPVPGERPVAHPLRPTPCTLRPPCNNIDCRFAPRASLALPRTVPRVGNNASHLEISPRLHRFY